MANKVEVYHGNCHCGAFRFELRASEIVEATVCDCTLCVKKGYLWFKLGSGDLTVTRDEELLMNYESKVLRDRFCGTCGTGVLGEHTKGSLEGQKSDIQPSGDEPKELGSLPVDPGAPPALHTASCHCGKVRVELLIPLSETKVKEDNCSSCVRDGYIGIYPSKDQVRVHGRDETFEYLYGRKFNGIVHCKTCGVTVFNNVYGPPVSVFDSLPPERKEKVLEMYWKNMALQPLNVRALDGVDLESLEIERTDEGAEGYVLPE